MAGFWTEAVEAMREEAKELLKLMPDPQTRRDVGLLRWVRFGVGGRGGVWGEKGRGQGGGGRGGVFLWGRG